MSFTCQQCGTTSTQPLNFCRRCGAPAQTVALGTSPLTTQIAAADPLDTWEPTKPVAAAIAATEALPAASTAAPVPPLLPSQPKPPASKAPAQAARLTRRGVLAGAAAGLLAVVVGGGYFWGQRPSDPAVESTAVSAPAATASPISTAPAAAPTVELAAALPASTPATGNAGVSVKPAAGNKTEGKAVAALPAPTPKTFAVAKSTAPELAAEKVAAPAPHAEEPKLSLLEQGNRLASVGQLQEAIQAYEKARRANPGNADVYYLLGSAYHRAGDLAKALEAYRQCTSGNYAGVAANHVRNLEKKLSKTPKAQAFAP